MSTNLMWHDLERCLRRTPPQVLALMKGVGAELFVAGGFVRACVSGEEINDIDLFCPEKEKALAWARQLLAQGGTSVHETDNAATVLGYKYPLQFIHRWTYTYPSMALNSFDFTISMAGFWAQRFPNMEQTTWQSACHERFYADVAAKRMIYTSPTREEEAGGSLLRVLKFYQRGYRIPLNSMGAVISRIIKGIDFAHLPTRPATHKKAPYTREEAITVAVIQLLREVDPEIDPNHIAHLPSEEEGQA